MNEREDSVCQCVHELPWVPQVLTFMSWGEWDGEEQAKWMRGLWPENPKLQ